MAPAELAPRSRISLKQGMQTLQDAGSRPRLAISELLGCVAAP